MRKRLIYWCAAALLTICLTACSGASAQQPSSGEQTPAPPASDPSEADSAQEPSSPDNASEETSHILVAYFTRLNNTDATLEEILQGGGPYGSLGTSLEDADLDAIASASITLIDGAAQGNVQTVAQMIQQVTGGDLFSIQTVDDYPVDYDTLIDQGGDEKNQDSRPALSTQVEHMEQYDVVFLGFPNWWYDAPRAVLSFIEAYDFNEKTVIPFATSAGSGFSGSIASIEALLPETATLAEGLHIGMNEVSSSREQVEDWIAGLGIQP